MTLLLVNSPLMIRTINLRDEVQKCGNCRENDYDDDLAHKSHKFVLVLYPTSVKPLDSSRQGTPDSIESFD